MNSPIPYALDFYYAVLQIHLKMELTKKSSETFHALDCDCPSDKQRPDYITAILKINGVPGGIKIDRYTIYIPKGEIFRWDEMIQPILQRLLIGIDPKGELLRMRPHREYYLNTSNKLMYKETELSFIPNPYRIVPKLPTPKDQKDSPEK